MPYGLNSVRCSHMLFKYKQCKENIITNALCQMYDLLNTFYYKCKFNKEEKTIQNTRGIPQEVLRSVTWIKSL